MAVARLFGDPAIEIRLKRSARARRLSLRVSSLDGTVTLTMPPGLAEGTALAFAEERRMWIDRALARVAAPVPVRPGTRLPLAGREVALAVANGSGGGLEGDRLALPARGFAAAARGVLKERARERLTAASDAHAVRLGVRYGRIAFRDTRSRWGSCSAAGRLMYSWRLAMAPIPVQDYVAAHEVAHLVRMDHSPAFWDVVDRLCPDWRAQRAWLRQEGPRLHRYRFED